MRALQLAEVPRRRRAPQSVCADHEPVASGGMTMSRPQDTQRGNPTQIARAPNPDPECSAGGGVRTGCDQSVEGAGQSAIKKVGDERARRYSFVRARRKDPFDNFTRRERITFALGQAFMETLHSRRHHRAAGSGRRSFALGSNSEAASIGGRRSDISLRSAHESRASANRGMVGATGIESILAAPQTLKIKDACKLFRFRSPLIQSIT